MLEGLLAKQADIPGLTSSGFQLDDGEAFSIVVKVQKEPSMNPLQCPCSQVCKLLQRAVASGFCDFFCHRLVVDEKMNLDFATMPLS